MITLRGSGDVQIAEANARRYEDEAKHYAQVLAYMAPEDERHPDISDRLARAKSEQHRWRHAIKKFETDGFFHGD